MNRYLIAALYVMAGCVVTVPLKVQGNILSSERGSYRLVITDTVKLVTVSVGEKADKYVADFFRTNPVDLVVLSIPKCHVSVESVLSEKNAALAVSHPIRAPEKLNIEI